MGSFLAAYVPFRFSKPTCFKNETVHDQFNTMGLPISDSKEWSLYSISFALAIKMCLLTIDPTLRNFMI